MRRILAAVTLAALVAAGCGVPLDDDARAVNRTTTTIATATTAPPDNGSDQVSVYYVNANGGLVLHKVEVTDSPTVRDALEILLSGEVPSSLKSSVPAGTEVIAVTENRSQVTVDLTQEVDDITGDSQRTAFAQIVFTVLAFPAYTSVRFSIEGTPVEAPTDGPNRAVVTASDYEFPLNPG